MNCPNCGNILENCTIDYYKSIAFCPKCHANLNDYNIMINKFTKKPFSPRVNNTIVKTARLLYIIFIILIILSIIIGFLML